MFQTFCIDLDTGQVNFVGEPFQRIQRYGEGDVSIHERELQEQPEVPG